MGDLMPQLWRIGDKLDRIIALLAGMVERQWNAEVAAATQADDSRSDPDANAVCICHKFNVDETWYCPRHGSIPV